MRSLIHRIENIRLSRKIILFYVVFFLVPLLFIVAVVFQIASTLVLEKTTYAATQAFEQTLSFLEYKMERLRRVSDMVATAPTLNEILAKDPANYTDYAQVGDHEYIKVYLQTLEDETDAYRMHLYVNDAFLYAGDGVIIEGLSKAQTQQWYSHIETNRTYFAPGAYLEEKEAKTHLALVRDILDMGNYKRRIGVLRIDTDANAVREILKKANPTTGAVTYLVNSEGVLVLSSDDALLEQIGVTDLMRDDVLALQHTAGEGLFLHEIAGQKVYAFSHALRHTDWTMITVVPHREMTQQITWLRNMLVLTVLVLVAVSLLIGTAVVTGLLRRIFMLVRSMQQVKGGDLNVTLRNDYSDEIGILYDNYNDMIKNTRVLMQEKYEMGRELKSAELNALHAQINPHFLYNTLEMVDWLGYQNRPEDIHRVVVSLSKFYRLTLNCGQDILSLREELAHVEYFVRIQSLRFPDSISYEADVPPHLLDVRIPKITLQPLVENAILHGILEKQDKHGKITISTQETDDTLLLLVRDDGVGMDAETLQAIFEPNAAASGSHYGLRNVDRRIRLYFGEQYGLSFTSAPETGTVATIRLPLVHPA